MNITLEWKDFSFAPMGQHLWYKNHLFGGVAYVYSIKRWEGYLVDNRIVGGYKTIGFFETEHDAKCAVEAELDAI